MALSPWTIKNDSAQPLQAGAKRNSAAAPAGDSFASVMARQQTENHATQTQPRVARLPESAGLPLRANLAGRTPSDIMRVQSFTKAQADMARARGIDSMAQSFLGNSSTLDIARGMNAAKNLRLLAANNNGRGFELSASDYIRTRNNAAKVERTRGARNSKLNAGGIGRLSAKFESGSDGIAAIGYDRAGGTSYGKYQIASRVGSMSNFLAFLDAEAPDLSRRLRKAGPANTGSRRGAMPEEWRAIAREQPERFEKLQESFIHQSHYKPALDAIATRTGIDPSSLSAAMREVIWSTAVQHGPAGAARIFERADDLSGKAGEAAYERKLINNVYNVRAGQFGSSSRQVRQAVQNRFREEKQIALSMLDATRANRA